MNTINTTQGSDPNNQQPFPAPSLLFLQNAYKEAIGAAAAMGIPNPFSSSPIVLWGCVNTGVFGTNYNITAGAIYYLGEIYLTSAFAFAQGGGQVAVCTITTTNPAPDPIIFQGGGSYNVHNIRRITIASALSGTGTFDFTSCVYVNEIWKNVAPAASTTYGGNNGVDLLPDFENSWENDNAGTENSAGFKIDRSRFVCLRGTIKTGASNTTAFTLPVGYRPLKLNYFIVSVPGDLTHWCLVAINSAGVVNVKYTAGAAQISLDGIRFALD